MIDIKLYKPKVYIVRNFLTGKRHIFCGNVGELRPYLNKLQRREEISKEEQKKLSDILGYRFPTELESNTDIVFALISPFDTFEMIKKKISVRLEEGTNTNSILLLQSDRKQNVILGHKWVRDGVQQNLPPVLSNFKDKKMATDSIIDERDRLLGEGNNIEYLTEEMFVATKEITPDLIDICFPYRKRLGDTNYSKIVNDLIRNC